MSRLMLLALCALITGCASCPPTHLNTGGPGNSSGAAVDDHMVAYIGPRAKLTTSNDMLLHITDAEPKANYWVLFGPIPGGKTPATATRHNSRTSVMIEDGYALYWGLWPIGTDGVEDTSAEGTTFVLQSVGKIHRSFLLSNPTGRPVHVYLTGTDPSRGKVLTAPGTYIEVLYDQAARISLSEPRKTNATPETRDFIAAVKARAIANGFNPADLE